MIDKLIELLFAIMITCLSAASIIMLASLILYLISLV